MAAIELKSGETRIAHPRLNRALEHSNPAHPLLFCFSQAYCHSEETVGLAEDNLTACETENFDWLDQSMVRSNLRMGETSPQHYAEAIQLCRKSFNMGPLDARRPPNSCTQLCGEQTSEQGLKAVEALLANSNHWAAGQQLLGELALQA